MRKGRLTKNAYSNHEGRSYRPWEEHMSAGTAKPSIPYVTSDQMREVDRLMIEEYGILLMQMMENAGRQLAHLARQRFMDGDPVGKTVLVLAGAGGNGGGGLVAARRLHSWGAHVIVYLPRPACHVTRGAAGTQIGRGLEMQLFVVRQYVVECVAEQ